MSCDPSYTEGYNEGWDDGYEEGYKHAREDSIVHDLSLVKQRKCHHCTGYMDILEVTNDDDVTKTQRRYYHWCYDCEEMEVETAFCSVFLYNPYISRDKKKATEL